MKYIKLFDNYTETTNKYIVTYELSSSALNIINVGMYNTSISPDNFLNEFEYNPDLDETEEEQQEEYDNLVNNFSNEKYKKMIIENAKEYIDKEVLPELKDKTECIISIEVTDLYSPKSYNYGSDELEFNLTVNKREIIKEISTMVGSHEFNEYLKVNYSSSDGFTSFMSNNLDKFDEELLATENEDSWKPVIQYLNFLLEKCEIIKFDEWLHYEDIYADYSEFQIDDELE